MFLLCVFTSLNTRFVTVIYIKLALYHTHVFLFTFLLNFKKKKKKKKNYTHGLYVYILGPTIPLCVLQNLLIKPALGELLILVNQLEQSKILLWVYMAYEYVLLHAHLRYQLTPTIWTPETIRKKSTHTRRDNKPEEDATRRCII